MPSYFALVDCNNFFVSCERIFEPSLEKRPVIVLSNNDGCAVARSEEAKKLGIRMGDPYFKIKDLCARTKIVVRSSNFLLYGDISDRIMQILAAMSQRHEIYSIDEAFLTFSSEETLENIVLHCQEIRRTIKQWVGVPVSIGIAPTKTLAKIAAKQAKKASVGVFEIVSMETRVSVLNALLVEDIWGIGVGCKNRLHQRAIYTAWQLQAQEPYAIKKLLGINGERILWELRGMSCFPLETHTPPKKSICTSRSFGQIITEQEEIAEALACHVNSASIKLRNQDSYTKAICVHLESLIDSETGRRHHDDKIITLPFPTNDTSLLIKIAKEGLEALYRSGERYKKCGVVLLDLVGKESLMPDLFSLVREDHVEVFDIVDDINGCFGKNSLFYGSMGVCSKWKTRKENCSSLYTNSWKQLPVVKA